MTPCNYLVTICLLSIAGCAGTSDKTEDTGTPSAATPLASSYTIGDGAPDINRGDELQSDLDYDTSGVNVTPAINGVDDPELLVSAAQALKGLAEPALLHKLVGSDGLALYAPFTCKPARLPLVSMQGSGLQAHFAVETCDGPGTGMLDKFIWSDYLEQLAQRPAVTQTDRIDVDVRNGIGIDTGTSYIAEQRYPPQSHAIISYLHLGSDAAENRDWDELGMVFERKGGENVLVAIFVDHFAR